MTWSNAYIGLPYVAFGRTREGCDCWGLARLVYRQELGIELPAYLPDGICAIESREIDVLVGAATRDRTLWAPVDTILAFDLLLFREGQYRSHIGIAVERGWMLHCPETGSALADTTAPRWGARFRGAWRWRGIA